MRMIAVCARAWSLIAAGAACLAAAPGQEAAGRSRAEQAIPPSSQSPSIAAGRMSALLGLPVPPSLGKSDVLTWAAWLGWSPERAAAVGTAVEQWVRRHEEQIGPNLADLADRAQVRMVPRFEFTMGPAERDRWSQVLADAMRLRDRIASEETAFVHSLLESPEIALSPEEAEAMLTLRRLSRSRQLLLLIGTDQMDAVRWLLRDEGWTSEQFADARFRPALSRYIAAAAAIEDRRARDRARLSAEFPKRFARSTDHDRSDGAPIWSHWSDVTTPNADSECASVRLVVQVLSEIDEAALDAAPSSVPLLAKFLARHWPGEFAPESSAIATAIQAAANCDRLDDERAVAVGVTLRDLRTGIAPLLRRRLDALLNVRRSVAITRQTQGVPLEPLDEDSDAAEESQHPDPLRRFLISKLIAMQTFLEEDCPEQASLVAAAATALGGPARDRPRR